MNLSLAEKVHIYIYVPNEGSLSQKDKVEVLFYLVLFLCRIGGGFIKIMHDQQIQWSPTYDRHYNLTCVKTIFGLN